jgi:hypothetical protein
MLTGGATANTLEQAEMVIDAGGCLPAIIETLVLAGVLTHLLALCFFRTQQKKLKINSKKI